MSLWRCLRSRRWTENRASRAWTGTSASCATNSRCGCNAGHAYVGHVSQAGRKMRRRLRTRAEAELHAAKVSGSAWRCCCCCCCVAVCVALAHCVGANVPLCCSWWRIALATAAVVGVSYKLYTNRQCVLSPTLAAVVGIAVVLGGCLMHVLLAVRTANYARRRNPWPVA